MEHQNASELEVAARVNQVYEWLCMRVPPHKITSQGVALWPVGPRQIQEYIKKAKEIIYDQAIHPEREKILQEALAQWDNYIERCQKANDRKNENIALKQINKISGLEVQRVDVTTNGESLNKIIVEIVYPETKHGN